MNKTTRRTFRLSDLSRVRGGEGILITTDPITGSETVSWETRVKTADKQQAAVLAFIRG
jgi:hypothetical protein